MPDDLAAAFAALWRHSALPPLMQAGVMESAGVLRHYVLLHDAASQGPEVLVAAQEKLHQLGSTLGTSCQVLSINSGSGGGSPVGPRLWADMLHGCLPDGGGGEPAERPPVPPGGLGAWLSEADMSGLAGFVHELAVRSILPHMEMRLRALNVQVRRWASQRQFACLGLLRPQRCPAHSLVLPLLCRPIGNCQPQRSEEPAEELALAQGRFGQCVHPWHTLRQWRRCRRCRRLVRRRLGGEPHAPAERPGAYAGRLRYCLQYASPAGQRHQG